MTPNTRGRHRLMDLWKPGERCQMAGEYECDTCKGRNENTRIHADTGALFPICAACADRDMGWRRVSG